MKIFAIIMSLLVLCSSALAYKSRIQQENELMQAKGCYCLAQWLGGLCVQWAGGDACNSASGKRAVVPKTTQEIKCLCLTWNSNGICIFCKP